MKQTLKLAQPILLIFLATSTLTACGTFDRLENVGQVPQQSPVVNPAVKNGYQPASMPMPAPRTYTRQANSLWTGSQKGFFKDQRAGQVGDILTVVIDIDDKGELKNETTRNRKATIGVGAPKLGGLETLAAKYLGKNFDASDIADVSAGTGHDGSGEIDREENIEMRLAATITQVLPNGNFALAGTQEVRVNFENRILKLAGVIRPEDVSVDNSVPYDKIAEARISYGGKGQISDVQQPAYGQQIFEAITPF